MLKVLRTGLTLFFALVLSACTVHQTEAPPLTGPSEFALSVRVTATPDSLALDGGSQSAIVVEARDANGAPRSGLPVRLDIAVGPVFEDCGQLSARNVVTGSDGRATSIFTAPAMPLPLPQCQGFTPGNTVTISATPSGNNFQTANQQTATIRLVPLGVILPPAATPSPCMILSPTQPSARASEQFTGGTLVSGVCGAATSDIVTFAWDFGDGSSGSGRTVTHTYTTAGTVNVTLTETNDRGVSASTTQAVAIGAGALPTADFQFSPSTPQINQTVVFDASAARPGAGHTLVTYAWVFGDGVTKTGVIVSHDFGASGIFSVTLTVTDEVGQSTTVAKGVTVGAGTATPLATFTVAPQSPVSSGTTVTVDASGSTAANGSTIVRYQWTFGELGGATFTSTAPTFQHTYTPTGTFTITLTVFDQAGRTATATRTITVQ